MPDHIFIPAVSLALIGLGYFMRFVHERLTRPRRAADAAWKQAYIRDARNLPITDR